jgi:hypothetical protein
MTTSISIDPETLTTGDEKSLSIGVNTKDTKYLFLLVPVGDAPEALMTEGEFDRVRLNWKIVKADGADSETPKADAGEPRIVENKGEVSITRNDESAESEASFRILVEKFTPRGTSDAIRLEVRDNDNLLLADTTVKVTDALPEIKEFAADRYIREKGQVTELSWVLKPKGRHRLLLDDKKTVHAGDGETGKIQVSESGTYRLEAMVGDTVTDKRSITLYFSSGTELKSPSCGAEDAPPGSLMCAEILGIYEYKAKPYAVVRDSAAGNSASLWYTERGFDRRDWVPVKTSDGTRVSIPVDAASRPGAVFDDRLYFMGGSSYDADRPGSEVGYFNFDPPIWVDQGIKREAWPKPPPGDQDGPGAPFPKPRMGHALLASPDGRHLWVIGGYNGDGGAMNDIWVYDKTTGTWAPRQPPLWEPRCLFGAAFCGSTLWIAGGFDSPGGYPTYDDIWYCDTSQPPDKWIQVRERATAPSWLSLIPGSGSSQEKQYRGCALAAMGNQIYAFVSYYRLNERGRNDVVKIFPVTNGWRLEELQGVSSDWATSGMLRPLDCVRFDATVFGGCIFIRRLARAATKDDRLHYLIAL